MSLPKEGWVFHHPDKPPLRCTGNRHPPLPNLAPCTGTELVEIHGVFVCPLCDRVDAWPERNPEVV